MYACGCVRVHARAFDDFFFSLQVTGGTSGPVVGSNLSSLLDNARKNKKDMGDDFISVEHIILAFNLDKRFGQQFLRSLGVSEKDLRDAVTAVRGNQRVTDQSMSLIFLFFSA